MSWTEIVLMTNFLRNFNFTSATTKIIFFITASCVLGGKAFVTKITNLWFYRNSFLTWNLVCLRKLSAFLTWFQIKCKKQKFDLSTNINFCHIETSDCWHHPTRLLEIAWETPFSFLFSALMIFQDDASKITLWKMVLCLLNNTVCNYILQWDESW